MNINRLHELITAKKLSKRKLTELAGISRPALDSILYGKDCRVSSLEKLAATLHVPISFFFDEQDDKNVVNVVGKHNQLNQEGAHDNINAADSEAAVLHERVRALEKLLAEKERVIQLYERLATDK